MSAYRNGFKDAMLVVREHIDQWMGEGGKDTLDDLSDKLWARLSALVDGAPPAFGDDGPGAHEVLAGEKQRGGR